MSACVTVSSVSLIAAINASTVRALARRKHVLLFDQHGSMGLKSGEEGDNRRRRAPCLASSSSSPATLWADRLSHSTMSPGCKVGPKTSLTQQ